MTVIPVNTPLLDGNERKYLEECITTGWISSEGPFIKKFEAHMAAAAGRKHGIAVCNGTVALEAAVAAIELEPGDQVIVPTFTIISCAAAVVRRGCIPIFVDSEPLTWNLDVARLEEKLHDEIDVRGNTKIKAIMVVHIYGLPTEMTAIMRLAERYGLKVIEDAAEMHGQTYDGRPCGSFGELSTFSFYPNKHVTTGEGGMIVTDDDRLAERCRSLRNLCFQEKRRFVHEELGFNFRMTNLQAALGLAQIERLDDTIGRKRRMGTRYRELLAGVKGFQLQAPRTEHAENIYWVFGLVLDDDVPFDAEEAMRRLAAKGIGTRPFFWPMHEQPVFQRMDWFRPERHPVSERLARRGFYVPSGVGLDEAHIVEVANAVRDLMSS